MNVVLPFDFQSLQPLSTSTSAGTQDARIENENKPIVTPVQQNSASQQASPKQAEQNTGQSNSKNKPAAGQSDSKNSDKVSLSKEAVNKQQTEKSAANSSTKDASTRELSEEEEKKVQELKDRDREVKTHEQAHAAVGGQYAGSPSYEYESGPDGKRYAVGGEVSIDVSEETEPEDTVQKMQVVRAAALAPAEPSTQDLKVAAEASQKEQKARAEMGQAQVSGEDKQSSKNDTKDIDQSTNSNQGQAKLAQAYADLSGSRTHSQFSASA
jgi:hypothetical protein